KDDLKRRPFYDLHTHDIADLGGYLEGDSVGARGVERTMEDQLRGKRGVSMERKDTGESTRIDPGYGRDVRLTLDIALQARVQPILSGEVGLAKVEPWHNNTVLPVGQPLNGAAVVLEIESGEILAMVSMPTIAMGVGMSPVEQQINGTTVNRAAETPYPPGS